MAYKVATYKDKTAQKLVNGALPAAAKAKALPLKRGGDTGPAGVVMKASEGTGRTKMRPARMKRGM